jgi:hypothetical protein
MADREPGSGPLATVALAVILLDQGLLPEARELLGRLERERAGDERIPRLLARLAELEGSESIQEPMERGGTDTVALAACGHDLELRWELTAAGLALGRRTARCSGAPVVRLLTVITGPRGVRKTWRDIALLHPGGRLLLRGLPRPAVHVAAAGFLARSGVFVPLCTSAPAEGSES